MASEEYRYQAHRDNRRSVIVRVRDRAVREWIYRFKGSWKSPRTRQFADLLNKYQGTLLDIEQVPLIHRDHLLTYSYEISL